MTPRLLGLVRGFRGANFDALADLLEAELEAVDEEKAALRARLEELTDAVVLEPVGETPKLRRMTNRALDLLIILDARELEGATPCA